MLKKVFSLLCALVFLCSFGLSVSALADRPAPEVVEGEKYVSDALPGASALYVSGQQLTLDNAFFYGAGYASDQEITDQIPNQYGLCAVVLGAGQDTEIVLNNPVIESDPESYANGVFAAAMAKITVNGGTIDTNNSSGHGIDATYMGHVYAADTVIHTRGETSGALATDFGGGFITGERLNCTTEEGSSPGIFCAGSTVIFLTDSVLTTGKATGVVVAHDHAVVVLNNCEVNAAGTAVSGLQALPSAASSDGSSCYVFGGKLTSAGGAVVGESGGRTVVNLIGTECTAGGDTAVSASGSSAGILTVNLWDTALAGNVECAEGCSVTINIYAGGSLTGEVSGEGAVEINVYDGGEYNGSFAANAAGEGEAAPEAGTFDDYLVSCWASGSSTWTESRAASYVNTVEPAILANSAACCVTEGAAAKAYDPEVYNPSETGVDLSLLNVGGAHGFTVDEIFGGSGSSAEDSGGSSFSFPSDFPGDFPDDFPSDFPGDLPDDFAESFGGSADGFSGFPETTEETAESETPADSGETAVPAESAVPDGSVVSTILTVGTTQAFTDDPVSADDLNTILRAGLAAASAINQQPWFFVAVTNRDVMDGITGSGFGGSAGGSAKAGLGDSPAAILIYRNDGSKSPNADFDCGLAAQNMVLAAASLGYGVKIVSSPTGTLNGADHDAICEKLGVDPSLQAVAVLLIGIPDSSADGVSGASVRESLDTKTVVIE